MPFPEKRRAILSGANLSKIPMDKPEEANHYQLCCSLFSSNTYDVCLSDI